MESDNQFASKMIHATKRFPNVDVADQVMSRIEQQQYSTPAHRKWSSRSFSAKAAIFTVVLMLSIMGGAYANNVWFGKTVDLHDSNGNVLNSVKIDDLKNYPNIQMTPSTSYTDYDSFISSLPAPLSSVNFQPPQGFTFNEGKVYQFEEDKAMASVYFQNDRNEIYEINVETDDGSSTNPNFLLSDDPDLEVTMLTDDQKEFMYVNLKPNALLFWSTPDDQGRTLDFTALGPAGAPAEELKAAAEYVLNGSLQANQ